MLTDHICDYCGESFAASNELGGHVIAVHRRDQIVTDVDVILDDIRHVADKFCCQSCKCENHADYNAAKNIGLRLLRNQTGGEGGAPVGVRLNTGMLNANGVKPLPDSARAEVHGEHHGP